jgi:hypothetical protein
MRRTMTALALALAVTLSGCYHATVTTGMAPAPAPNAEVSRSMASGWLWGLVPPSITDTAAQCPRGVSRVETQISVGNRLVSWLTGGIYTPMSVVATCAAD